MNFGIAWPEPCLVTKRVASRVQIPQTVTAFQNFIKVTHEEVLTLPSLSFPVRMNSWWVLKIVGHVHSTIESKFKWTASTILPISDKMDTGRRELWSVISWKLPVYLNLSGMGVSGMLSYQWDITAPNFVSYELPSPYFNQYTLTMDFH